MIHRSVQQLLDTDGEIKCVWATAESAVVSLSSLWRLYCSESLDGTILIRKSDNGEVEVGPIETKQCLVNSVAYSPSGGRIASGGDGTIRIWDSKTREPLVSPVEDLQGSVSSIMIVWSSDGSKLYSSSDNFARVLESVSGTQHHRFENDKPLHCIALSSKHNVLACVGWNGTAQLWDTRILSATWPAIRREGWRKPLLCEIVSRWEIPSIWGA